MRTCLYGHLITPPLITSLHFQRDIIGNSALKNITRFWLAENECILTWHECKVVTRVQSCNTSAKLKREHECKLQTACFQNFVCLSKTTNYTRPAGSCTFCLWKICSCLFTPNSIRNHLITYTCCILDLTVLDELILCSELLLITPPPSPHHLSPPTPSLPPPSPTSSLPPSLPHLLPSPTLSLPHPLPSPTLSLPHPLPSPSKRVLLVRS